MGEVETAVMNDEDGTAFVDMDVTTKKPQDQPQAKVPAQDDDKQPQDQQQDAPDADKAGEEEKPSGDEAADPDALPEYDGQSEEVRAAYDERYFKDGELNREVISKEFWKSYAKAGGDVTKAGLNEGTYAYLKDTVGLAKEMVKDIEAALVARHVGAEQADVAKIVGDVGRYNNAIKWAQEGGYSEAKRKAYTAAYAQGGEAREFAIEALMSSYDRAASSERRGPPRSRQRSSSPPRDATGSSRAGASGAASSDVFASKEEHSKAWDAALAARKEARDGGDRKAIAKAEDHLAYIQRKARRSRFA